MAKLIDMDKINKITASMCISADYARGYNACIEEMCKQVEERRGKWVFNQETADWGFPYLCTNCGKAHNREESYCPNCGAEMF